VGDGNGLVGYGLGKPLDFQFETSAIRPLGGPSFSKKFFGHKF
jgi:hypothetical protein